jgi:hypothetical protein
MSDNGWRGGRVRDRVSTTDQRQPEAWQTSAPGPFLTIGDVNVQAFGRQRFKIVSPSCEVEVEGFEEARQRARALAGLDA